MVTYGPRSFGCFGSYCLEHFAIDPACMDHYARTVSEWTKDNTVSFGLRGMIRRFRKGRDGQKKKIGKANKRKRKVKREKR